MVAVSTVPNPWATWAVPQDSSLVEGPGGVQEEDGSGQDSSSYPAWESCCRLAGFLDEDITGVYLHKGGRGGFIHFCMVIYIYIYDYMRILHFTC